MSIDNGIADADTLLNENSCSVAEEAENLMSIIWMSFTFLSGNSVKLWDFCMRFSNGQERMCVKPGNTSFWEGLGGFTATPEDVH